MQEIAKSQKIDICRNFKTDSPLAFVLAQVRRPGEAQQRSGIRKETEGLPGGQAGGKLQKSDPETGSPDGGEF